MIKPLTLSCILFLFLGINTFAQETQVSLLEDISYVYIEKLIAVAKENYPRVKTHDSRIAIADAAVTIAKLSWLSPLSISYV